MAHKLSETEWMEWTDGHYFRTVTYSSKPDYKNIKDASKGAPGETTHSIVENEIGISELRLTSIKRATK